MRVAHIIYAYPPEYTGHGRQVRSLMPYLRERGVECGVVTSCRGRIDTYDDHAASPIWRLGCGTLARSRGKFAAAALRWCLTEGRRFDIFHVHGIDRFSYAVVAAARMLRKPCVLTLTLLGQDDPQTIGASRLGKLKLGILGRANGIVAISSALTESTLRTSWEEAKIWRIPVGVDLQRFSPASEEERTERAAEFGWASDTPTALFLGAVIRRKGVDLLARAWPEVVARVPRARLLIVGPTDGASTEFSEEFVSELRAAFDREDVKQTVRLIGGVPDPERYLDAADVLVLPSRNEGLPNVILEAQAMGLACVVTDMPGVAGDVVVPDVTGLVVPHEDPGVLADALVALLSDRARTQALGREARKRVEAEYSLEHVADETVAMYRENLQEPID